jgi:SAM-dependent methyltransferase
MNTEVFRDYAAYYNLLYRDKDYISEVDYIETLLAEASTTSDRDRILDIGCGTGRHAVVMAERGHTVVGLDASDQMINLARIGGIPSTRFVVADARRFDLSERFDVAVSLFHVASYQTSNKDLYAYFGSVSEHLESEGLFVFDCWYGPAVLHQKPTVRVKEIEDDSLKILRIARPELEPEANCVMVTFDLMIERKVDGQLHRLREEHRMRYLFLPEIKDFLRRVGMRLVRCEEWMTRKPLGLDTWSACFVASKSRK